jgi:hypothetical protein
MDFGGIQLLVRSEGAKPKKKTTMFFQRKNREG